MSEEKTPISDNKPSFRDLEYMFPSQFGALAMFFCFPPELRSKVMHLLMVATNGKLPLPTEEERIIAILESDDITDVLTYGGKKYDEMYRTLSGFLVMAEFDRTYDVKKPQLCTTAAQYHEWAYQLLRPFCREEVTEGVHLLHQIDRWWEIPQIEAPRIG